MLYNILYFTTLNNNLVFLNILYFSTVNNNIVFQFPYCDGSHNKHNATTGDNLGPLIINNE